MDHYFYLVLSRCTRFILLYNYTKLRKLTKRVHHLTVLTPNSYFFSKKGKVWIRSRKIDDNAVDSTKIINHNFLKAFIRLK